MSDFYKTWYSDWKSSDLSDFAIVSFLSLCVHKEKRQNILNFTNIYAKFIFDGSKCHHNKTENATWFYFVTKLNKLIYFKHCAIKVICILSSFDKIIQEVDIQ